jgi:ketosteroid isomerase-like protein
MDALDEFWRLFNEGRLDDAISLCSPEFEYVDTEYFPAPVDAASVRDAMRLVLDAAPDRTVTITRRFDKGDGSGVLETTWQGTFTGADEPTTKDMVVIFETKDERITRQRIYYG